MTELSDKVKNIQTIWKQLTLLGAWLSTIAGSFLLPLPDWGSDEQQSSHAKFILFIATIVAGFMLLFTYKNKHKRTWLYISVFTCLLFIGSFVLYNLKRETNTLPFSGTSRVIGNVTLPNFDSKCKDLGIRLPDKNLLKYVGGDVEKLWTKASIDRNRNELFLYLALSYCLLAIFMISFVNAIILYTSQE
jgi:hypothetical protein